MGVHIFQVVEVGVEIFGNIGALAVRTSLDLFQSARVCAVLHYDDDPLVQALISAPVTRLLFESGDGYSLPISDCHNYEMGAAHLKIIAECIVSSESTHQFVRLCIQSEPYWQRWHLQRI